MHLTVSHTEDISKASLWRHTYWSLLVHFDKVGPTLVVELPSTAVIEQRHVQFFLQVVFQLPQLQSPDTIGTVHRELLLVVCAVGLVESRSQAGLKCQTVKRMFSL